MISISDARQRILARTERNPSSLRGIGDAVSLVLASDVTSDLDLPPFDKAMVDGFALRTADLRSSEVELTVSQQLTAGSVPLHGLDAGTAMQIMTGAPLPDGADAVVMIEQTTVDDPQTPHQVRVDGTRVVAEQNIMRRGAVARRGKAVLRAGHVVRPVDAGLLAEVGCTSVPVIEPPSVAVLATGSELTPPGQLPPAGKIRNSNGPLLCMLARAQAARVDDLGICRDEVDLLRQHIERGLDCDVLLLSGGVSAGALDLVPQVLEQLGVEKVFHKVEMKPGKPLWFGVRQQSRRCLVFGLPGNPVGSLVCFELFVAPALRALRGLADVEPAFRQARWAAPFEHRSNRPTYHPAWVELDADLRLRVTSVVWQGSSDQQALAAANCLVFLPPERRAYEQDEPADVLLLTGERLW